MVLPLPEISSLPLAGHSLVSWEDNGPQFGCHCGVPFSRRPVLPGFDTGLADGNVTYPELTGWFGMHCAETLGAGTTETTISLADAINLGVVELSTDLV